MAAKKTKGAKKENKKIEAQVSEEKKQILSELVKLIDTHNTIMIASIVNISSLQFQKLKRLLKGKAIVKVVKRNLALKAFEKAKEKKQDIEQLEPSIKSNIAILLSSLESYELAAILAENKKPAKIKAGQIASQEIVIEAGPTDLPAGPAISDLSKVNLKAGIVGGKIVIKERAVLTKKGEKVSDDVASVLSKLEIMPLSVGLEPLAAYDSKEKKIYRDIKVDRQGAINELKLYSQQSIALAIHITYPTAETIKLLLGKANVQGNLILNMTNKTN